MVVTAGRLTRVSALMFPIAATAAASWDCEIIRTAALAGTPATAATAATAVASWVCVISWPRGEPVATVRRLIIAVPRLAANRAS